MTQTIEAQTEANRQWITETFEAWRDGTGTLPHTFATDMVWRIEGDAAVSREYTSKQDFIDGVLKPFGARFSDSEPFRPIRIRSIYADGTP
jgi:ketosteroid isomerase-like protein